jgi:superfamily II DNA or RNA helicase
METKLRVGLSGTLPKGFKFYQMVGLTGPKVADISVTELQDQGFISQCDITRLNIDVKEVTSNRELLFNTNSIYKVNSVDETGMSLVGSGDPFRAEQKYMVDNCEKLFQPVLNYIVSETTLDDNTIVLFDRTEMGERLFNYLSLLQERNIIDRTPLFIDGSIPVAERERVRKYVEEHSGCLLLGQSAILSTGINIKSLSKLVLFVGGKSMARTIQSIGRILRLKDGKQAECIDVCYSFKYSKRHAAERKRLFKEFYNKTKFDKVVDIQI